MVLESLAQRLGGNRGVMLAFIGWDGAVEVRIYGIGAGKLADRWAQWVCDGKGSTYGTGRD